MMADIPLYVPGNPDLESNLRAVRDLYANGFLSEAEALTAGEAHCLIASASAVELNLKLQDAGIIPSDLAQIRAGPVRMALDKAYDTASGAYEKMVDFLTGRDVVEEWKCVNSAAFGYYFTDDED
jgi:hypothetical protein